MEIRKTRFQRLKEEQTRLRKEIRERTIGYILAAFSLVAGLAWNEAIKAFIEQFFSNSQNSVAVKFLYAILVTMIIVIITVYLAKLIEKKEEIKK